MVSVLNCDQVRHKPPGCNLEKPGFLSDVKCLVWHLGLLLKQGQVIYVLLADHSILKTILTDNGLKLRLRRVRIAGEGIENNLVRRYTSQDCRQDVQVLGELVLRLVDCLLVWRP